MSDDTRKTFEERVEESQRLLDEFRQEIIDEARKLYRSEMERLTTSIPETIDNYMQQAQAAMRQKLSDLETNINRTIKQREIDLSAINAEIERRENIQQRVLDRLERSLRAQESVMWFLGILIFILVAALILLALKTFAA